MAKLDELRTKLNKHQIDALLVTGPFNLRYITNFTGTAGIALITANEALFVTDFRYIDQAEEQAKKFTIINHEGNMNTKLEELISELNIERLGFEETDVTYAQYVMYTNELSAQLIPVQDIIESLRLIKTAEEINLLKTAAQIADDAYTHILEFIKPGVREIEIANELEFFMRKQGAASSSFDIIVASGYRSALPHGVASDKVIQTGELVTLDYGALYKGYCSDITRTVAVGTISDELTTIYQTVLEAQKRGVQGIKPNMTGKQADAVTRNYINEAGYGEYFGHSTGHGIGLEVHEGPGLSPRSNVILKENMVVTVEPGIYVPDIGGCRIEDDIVLTEDGNERLTNATKELIHL